MHAATGKLLLEEYKDTLFRSKRLKGVDLLIYNLILGLIIDASCNDTYNSGGYLMSPNYPQQYEKDLDCRWTIKAPVENIITLTVSAFDTACSPECDNLYIYDGANSNGRLLTTLSGDDSMPFTSTGNTIYLKFSTDNNDNDYYSDYYFGDSAIGFKILVEAVGKDT